MQTFVRIFGSAIPALPKAQRRRVWVELGDGLHLAEFPGGAILVPHLDLDVESGQQTLFMSLMLSSGETHALPFASMAARLQDCLLRAVECVAHGDKMIVNRCLFEVGTGAACVERRGPVLEVAHA